jgi:GH25 family lysozyme M1 (1,4-beta-N-acetylmuramidase)
MPYYKLKFPTIVDFYEGEYPVNIQPVYRVILKASGKFLDGVRREDKRVREYVQLCKDKGQAYGLYHFLLPNNITEQVDLFLNVSSQVGAGQMPLTLDVECDPGNYGLSRLQWGHQIKAALDRLEAAMGYKPIIYTSIYFWGMVDAYGWNVNDYPLWAAQYPRPATYVDQTHAPYPLPKGWIKWAMWQYAEDGRTQGYFINDLNTISDWFKTYLDTNWGNTPPPNGGSMIRWIGKVKESATPFANVRQTPNGLDIGNILPNTPIDGVGDLVAAGNYTWMNIVTPQTGWVATSVLDYTEVTPPTAGIVFEPFDLYYTEGGVRKVQRFTPDV